MSFDTRSDILTKEKLFNKDLNDLQEGVRVEGPYNDQIVGTLKYVEDYSSAFGEKEKSGNFIALHFNSDADDITVKITNPVELDEDRIFVGRIKDKSRQTITVVASKDGKENKKVYSLKGLTCLNSN